MAYLCIRNEGEIDIAALMLLGATDKEGSNKIGFFVTGGIFSHKGRFGKPSAGILPMTRQVIFAHTAEEK